MLIIKNHDADLVFDNDISIYNNQINIDNNKENIIDKHNQNQKNRNIC